MSPTAPAAVAVVDTCILLAAFNRKDAGHDRAVHTLGAARLLVVSPLVLAELDQLLTVRIGEHAALDAVTRLGAMARTGHLQIAGVNGSVLREAEALMRRYSGHALGLTDTVNATLAWQSQRPVILSTDRHYSDVLAPRSSTERRLEVLPGSAA